MSGIVKSGTSVPVGPQPIPKERADHFFRLISLGGKDDFAMAEAGIPFTDFLMAFWKDPAFHEGLQAAYKMRGDHWQNKIIEEVDILPEKDDVPGHKLKFEKLKQLAKWDNPDKYGDKTKTTVDHTHNISISVKNMSVKDAQKILADDPFSVPLEADFKVVEEELKKPKEYSL